MDIETIAKASQRCIEKNPVIVLGSGASMPHDIPGMRDLSVYLLRRKSFTEDKDEIETYWLRFEPEGLEESEDGQYLRMEGYDKPCEVGFLVDKERSCPLFEIEPTINNPQQLLDVVKRVAAFRKAQAAAKWEEEASK